MATPGTVAAYMALFAAIGFVFLFATLVVGWLLRPREPNTEKLEVYECGEPTIGSSFVQFDLRFYVVALLFIIFDVEVAFFFPWATVYGKATQLMDPNLDRVTVQGELTPDAKTLLNEMGVRQPTVPPLTEARAAELGPGVSVKERGEIAVEDLARTTALFSIGDIAAFFAVLLVGFAYVWKRGDLDWVRALSKQRAFEMMPPRGSPVVEEDKILVH